jgi:phosphonate transport system substrate-binding protein
MLLLVTTLLAAPALNFGVLPAADAEQMQQDFTPLLTEMEAALGRPVKLVIPADYADILHRMIEGEVNVALMSPYMYVSIKADVQKDVVAQRRDAATYRGVCVVKEKSAYKSMADLAGKKIAYVHVGSTAGHLYPRIAMRAQKLDPKTHFKEVVFAGSHDKVLEMVAKGEVDVGCVSERTFKNKKLLRQILQTEPIPDDVVIARSGVSETERAKLKAFFEGAAKNPKLADFMKTQGIASFVAPDVSVYQSIEAEIARD